MADTIAENLELVYERIRQAARKSGRDAEDIILVCAAKTVEAKAVKKAVAGGARVFGENYVQEAEEKIRKVRDKSVRWHLIGHLQKNKVKKAVELFDVIETVDSLKLAELINRRTEKPMDVLIQVNIAGEDTKKGVDPQDVVELARGISGLEKVNLRGLMAIPPVGEDPEASRPYFITLRRLAERVNREIPELILSDLSMGMSTDFDVAIEEGATMVRVGRAIFGEREEEPKKKAPAKKKAEPKKKAPARKKAAAPKKKATAKKTTAKKAEPKKKAAARKAEPKKAAPKKKTTAKKAEPKKKTAAKKAAPGKKAAEKKTTAKKTTVKKTAAKKSAAKKPAAKKAEPKKKTTAKKAAPKKKAAAKKAGTKKKAAEKKTAKKAPAKKAAKKK